MSLLPELQEMGLKSYILIEELESRDELPLSHGPYDAKELVEQIWMLRRNGKDYQRVLDDLIYAVTGRII